MAIINETIAMRIDIIQQIGRKKITNLHEVCLNTSNFCTTPYIKHKFPSNRWWCYIWRLFDMWPLLSRNLVLTHSYFWNIHHGSHITSIAGIQDVYILQNFYFGNTGKELKFQSTFFFVHLIRFEHLIPAASITFFCKKLYNNNLYNS